MAVKLRLKRFGRLNHPTYRLCAADSRSPRDGRIIETDRNELDTTFINETNYLDGNIV